MERPQGSVVFCNFCKTDVHFKRFPAAWLVHKVQTIARQAMKLPTGQLFNPPEIAMFTDHSDRHLPADLQAHARLMDAARAQASHLRSAAIRDFGTQTWADFWRGADAVWQRMQPGQAAGRATTRSATRLQTRLARHQALRGDHNTKV